MDCVDTWIASLINWDMRNRFDSNGSEFIEYEEDAISAFIHADFDLGVIIELSLLLLQRCCFKSANSPRSLMTRRLFPGESRSKDWSNSTVKTVTAKNPRVCFDVILTLDNDKDLVFFDPGDVFGTIWGSSTCILFDADDIPWTETICFSSDPAGLENYSNWMAYVNLYPFTHLQLFDDFGAYAQRNRPSYPLHPARAKRCGFLLAASWTTALGEVLGVEKLEHNGTVTSFYNHAWRDVTGSGAYWHKSYRVYRRVRWD